MNTRQRWLALALLAVLAAAFWPKPEEESGPVEPAVRTALPARPAAPAVRASAAPGAAASQRLAAMQANLFPEQSWVPPPPKPKPSVAAPPPPPSPPPLPFKYLGRWLENGRQTLFLLQGEQPVAIKPGQVLQGSWRVEEITDRQVVFTYLPLNMQSILEL